MAIDIECRTANHGWQCTVRVIDRGEETSHSVAVSRAELARLDPGASDPDGLVRASFEFLLERESNASILRSFALSDIGRYFQDYEPVITRR